MTNSLDAAEATFFERFSGQVNTVDMPLLFILGSPRTGSTLIYQILVNSIRAFFFSNFVENHFANHPVIGVALEQTLNPHEPVSYESAFGKTKGLWEPSEASKIFRNWFGGEHPSQLNSCDVISSKETHLIATMQCIYALTGNVIITKNAWNCFRIKAIKDLFPRAHFLWIRRDLGFSALSDLQARYFRGNPEIWNSATTANYREIQTLPYWEQVVEQQYEYNQSIATDLKKFAGNQFLEIWYEDLCDNTDSQMEYLQNYLTSYDLVTSIVNRNLPTFNRSFGTSNSSNEDLSKIQGYIREQEERFLDYMYLPNRPSSVGHSASGSSEELSSGIHNK
ncbi:MAG: sulfotransferase [Chloroflexi bacterium]|nr:MAG: sulfotransferase [Chloroflexota bacterium]MBL1193127.1 sulfotransferase [Chloroflexota bacterium]NOH10420.1 sulfotransferase [Chloroflexota bacterium]